MELPAIASVLLLVVIIFFMVRAIIRSIHLFLLILLVLLFLVFFFDISISEISAWLLSKEILQQLTGAFINGLLFSFGN